MTLAVLFTTFSIQHSIPPKLLESVCWIESNHKVEAINKDDGKGDSIGVCQVKYSTARWLGYKGTEKDLFKPENNIKYAAKYLSYQLKRYKGDKHRATTAYNRGNAKGLTKSRYSEKVMKKYRSFK